jgi:hypothetical protein
LYEYLRYCLIKSLIDIKVEINHNSISPMITLTLNDIMIIDYGKRSEKLSKNLFRWFLMKSFIRFLRAYVNDKKLQKTPNLFRIPMIYNNSILK